MSTFRSSFATPKPLQIKDDNPYFAAVRHSADGYDWLDTSTLSGSPEAARYQARQTDARIPVWATSNKIVAIAHVTLTLESAS